MSESTNLTDLLGLRRDRYARNLGPFELWEGHGFIGEGVQVWDWMREAGGLLFRVAYICENLVRRDMIGRQGVWKSKQDGIVTGEGHAMSSRDGLTLSLNTQVYGGQGVCKGSGKGYRTMRADRILFVNLMQGDAIHSQYATQTGLEIITMAKAIEELN